MKTIQITLFSFSELSEKAKSTAINTRRNNDGVFTDHVYDEAYNTVKAFNLIFGTKEGYNSWLDVRTGLIDDNILTLSGLRLRKYIINNYFRDLYKGKYYYKTGFKATRRSKIIFENSCVLTGVCYDDSILAPIYKLISGPIDKNLTFDNLMMECFDSLRSDIESEIEYLNSNEAIVEDLEINGYEFTEDGKRF